MSKYWSETVKSLVPYVPGEQPKDRKYIKLNTNENPYPPSPKAIAAIQAAADADLRLYPDPNCGALTTTIAEYYGLNADHIFVGNGSDEILAFSFMTFFDREKPILFPDITYSFYKVYANLFGIPVTLVPLDDEFNVPLERLKGGSGGGIILPNPNAPTAKYIPLESIREVVAGNPDQVVIIDEAYIDFGGESAIPLIHEFPNLLVVQTLSKSRSLAGLRVGYAVGNAQLIEGLNRVKNSFNSYTLDRLALAGAVAAFQDEEYFTETTRKVMKTREAAVAKLQAMGFRVLESKANFILISHHAKPAKTLFQELRKEGVLVRYFEQPRIDQYLRVTIGTDEEMEVCLQVLQRLVEHTG